MLYEQQLGKCVRWMAERPQQFRVLEVRYADRVSQAAASALAINAFGRGTLDDDAMAAAVDPGLYRNRA